MSTTRFVVLTLIFVLSDVEVLLLLNTNYVKIYRRMRSERITSIVIFFHNEPILSLGLILLEGW